MEACLTLYLVSGLAHAVGDHHGIEAGPVVALAQSGDSVDHRGGPDRDAAVIAIHGLVATYLAILEPDGLLLGHEQSHILRSVPWFPFKAST